MLHRTFAAEVKAKPLIFHQGQNPMEDAQIPPLGVGKNPALLNCLAAYENGAGNYRESTSDAIYVGRYGVYEAVQAILTADQHVTTWECALLSELRMKFRL